MAIKMNWKCIFKFHWVKNCWEYPTHGIEYPPSAYCTICNTFTFRADYELSDT